MSVGKVRMKLTYLETSLVKLEVRMKMGRFRMA